MTKQQRKIIEREFYRYKFNKRESENYAVFAVAYDSAAPDGERVKSGGGNKNEQLVIRAIYDQERMRAWCKVFEYTLIKFKGEHKDRLMQKRYIEKKKPLQTSYELSISPRTYDYWVEDILEAAYRYAKDDFKLF